MNDRPKETVTRYDLISSHGFDHPSDEMVTPQNGLGGQS